MNNYKRSKQGRFTSTRASRTEAVEHLSGRTLSLMAIAVVFLVFVGTFTMAGDPMYFFSNYVAHAAVSEATEPVYTVLDAIADCESGTPAKGGRAVKWSGRQFYKNGQVVRNINKAGKYAGTWDVGKYQVNVDIHGNTAGKMGLNLYTEEGNKAFAEYLYKRNGTSDWNSSKACWSQADYKEI